MATTQNGNRGTRKAAAKTGGASKASGAKKNAANAQASTRQAASSERGRKATTSAGAKKAATRTAATAQAGARKAAARPTAAASAATARPAARKGAAREETARKAPVPRGAAAKAGARKGAAPGKRTGAGRGRARQLDAIELLTQDHQRVEKLIKQFERLKKRDGDDADKAEVARQICEELTLHAQLEEEIFYPAMRESLGKDEDLVDEAKVEHDSAKALIAQVQGAQAGDPMFDAYVTVLGEYVMHHVEEEEGEMFKKAKRAKVDMAELGERIAQRKSQLQGGEDAGAGSAGGALGEVLETAGEMAAAAGVMAADTAAGVIGAFAGDSQRDDRS